MNRKDREYCLELQINKDIEYIDEILKNSDSKKAYINLMRLISAYEPILPKIKNDLYYKNFSTIDHYKLDLESVKKKLQIGMTSGIIFKHFDKNEKSELTILNQNTNLNSNTIDVNIEMEFNNARDYFENNGNITPSMIKEIIEKIDYLEEVNNSADTRPNKWEKAGKIINWLTTTGVDTGMKIMPIITKMLENQ